jgi:hypothetical protein
MALLVELQEELNSVTMRPTDDPAVLFGKLLAIRNKYNNAQIQVSSEQVLAAAIRAVPKEYKAVVTCEQPIKGTLITITDLELAMHQHWRAIKHMNKTKRSKFDKELTLSAFDGTCFNCGKKGHKSTKCKNKKKAGGKTSKGKLAGKCSAWGKPGQMARTCWENDENAHLRLKNWTSGKVSQVAVIATVELLLGAIDGVTKDGDWCVQGPPQGQ